MNELKIYKLNCASCNSNLEVPSDIDKFNCSYCGTQQIVQRSGGIIALREVIDAVNKVQIGTDKTAAELALIRLQKEQNDLDYKLGEREKFWNHYINEQIKPFDVKLETNSNIAYTCGVLAFIGLGVLLFGVVFAFSKWFGVDTNNQSKDTYDFIAYAVIIPSICLGAFVVKYLKKSNAPILIEKEKLLETLTKEKDNELESITVEIRENLRTIERNRSVVKNQD